MMTIAISIIALLLFIGAILAFFGGIIYFGFAGFFTLFGVQYDSGWSLLLFLLIYMIVDAIFDILVIPFMMMTVVFRRNPKLATALRILLKLIFAWAALHTVDEMMSSIDIPTRTEIILVLVLFLFELATDDRKMQKLKRNNNKA